MHNKHCPCRTLYNRRSNNRPSYYKGAQQRVKQPLCIPTISVARPPAAATITGKQQHSSFLGNIEEVSVSLMVPFAFQPQLLFLYIYKPGSRIRSCLLHRWPVIQLRPTCSVTISLTRFTDVQLACLHLSLSVTNKPMLLYNPYRWDIRIRPLLYQESKKAIR